MFRSVSVSRVSVICRHASRVMLSVAAATLSAVDEQMAADAAAEESALLTNVRSLCYADRWSDSAYLRRS